eukprot:CAMPEP_0201945774 /NCGR_PEP_ID=MMETSP0903-20130614/54076_1 /ASSEMBLY_ACC=CAM_ASM_000552 /TAXON_ID=420261 /ORGANISM="Thalassiosira antarctica, Strain CCMP982" /LENGTH=1119 /DNA_ID=CAMNT_0048488849 /DNA_START=137 /DNA_END=3498 /DNA_ORIENTATION=-
MARHHQSKRAASRSSASSLATLVTVALLTHGTADLALARRDDSSSSHGRRARAAGSVRGGGSIGVNGNNGKVNLLVKYKNSVAQTRSLGNIDSNDSPLNTWQAHITSTSTISEERHISSVEIDASEINLVWEEMMADEDVELVEEDFPMYLYPLQKPHSFPRVTANRFISHNHNSSSIMARHQRKRAASRSSSSSMAATLVTVALLTHGAADLALARGDDSSSWDAKARKSPHGRRARAAGSVRGGGSIGVNGTVNLLVKYKNSLAQTRSLGNIDSNDSPLNTWQSHATSISTISEERHISAVEINATEIDLVWEELMADEDVELVEEDFPMYKTPYNSIQQDSSDSDQTSHLRHKDRHLKQQQNRTLMESQQYGIAQIQASAVWALTKKYPNKYPNTPVKVCIIDTGYDGSHEDLPTVGVTGTNTGYGDALQDGDGHGTHCAGVIGAVGDNGRGIVGVNPDPTKFSFHIAKALNDDGVGTASSVLKGIQGCISSGAKIISMSLGGGPKSAIFQELYKEAYDKDVLVFAAAGNVGVMQDDYPATYPLVVSVGAVDKNGNRADFSNWNDQLELMGPGVDIYSTFPGSGYGMLSGTSMATPYVAGVAALVWGYFPQCSNQQMRNEGIQGCISSGAKIISMSLGGGPKSPMFDALYEEAYDKNILVFAAAGNVGVMRDDFPASYPLVVSVGAVDKAGNRADFSNWNDQLELMGPGVDIVSTIPGNRYGMLSGTSMATPFVAGVAALVWGYFPQCSNQQMRNVLAKTAKSLTTNGSDCNRKTGFGLVQAKEAFDLLDKYGCAAGGEDSSPPSVGGVGGCGQPLADTTKLTPVSKLNTASVLGGASSDNGCKKLSLKLLTDDYAYEISWELKRVDNGEVLNNGPPGNRNFEDKSEYNGPASGCLDPGTYEFAIKDIYGDGITAPGFYSITLDGRTLARNSNFGTKEITSFTIDSSQNIIIEPRQPDWISLLYEGFSNGFGKFNDGGADAIHVDRKFGRNGMVMIKEGTTNYHQASVFSNNIPLNDRDFTKFKVVFSFYANSMEMNDRFCLDYSANGASAWSRAKCWRSGGDFENGDWNDNVEWVFQPTANAVNSIRIRFRGFSSENFDRVFIDKIQLFGQTELT